MKKPNERYTVCVDFDGVLHQYISPWIARHVIPDPPVAGAIEWLHRLLQKFDMVILSTRGRTWRGRRAIRQWLKLWGGTLWNEAMDRGLEDVKVTDRKVAALVYIDDRGYRFTGENFPTVDEVHRMKPWNKR